MKKIILICLAISLLFWSFKLGIKVGKAQIVKEALEKIPKGKIDIEGLIKDAEKEWGKGNMAK